MLKRLGFSEEVERVNTGLCPFCRMKIDLTEFRDVLSLKEYRISGLCQKCQDKTFGR